MLATLWEMLRRLDSYEWLPRIVASVFFSGLGVISLMSILEEEGPVARWDMPTWALLVNAIAAISYGTCLVLAIRRPITAMIVCLIMAGSVFIGQYLAEPARSQTRIIPISTTERIISVAAHLSPATWIGTAYALRRSRRDGWYADADVQKPISPTG